MKKIFLLLSFSTLVSFSFSQKLARITITELGNLDTLSYQLNEGVIVNVSKDGRVINWGVDRYIDSRGLNYPGTIMDPYTGRVEYYSENDNEAFRGKVKYIGMISFTYYASYDNEALRGKLRSIGRANFDYYLAYEDESYRGNIKSINEIPLMYYSSFDRDKGKLKNVGPTSFSYYSPFEDNAYKGKIKSIDGSMFTYFSSHEHSSFNYEYPGRMKTGSQQQFINGIKYFIKF